MKCTFYRPENVNLNEYENIIEKMNYDLKTLVSEKMDQRDVYYYVRDLTNEAKPLEIDDSVCFWGMDDPRTMPSDARCDFFYRPTYIATAFLMQAILKYPELENGNEISWEFGDECVEALWGVLPKAMKACTGRGFSGHGYDGLKGQFETMEIFLMAGATDFVKKYPDLCPEFTNLLNDTIDAYKEKLATGNTKGGWDEDYSERIKQVLLLAESPF